VQPPAWPHRPAPVLPHEVERHGEEPRPRIRGRRLERACERLLGDILGAVAVTGAAVDHPHQRRVIQLKQLTDIGHVPLKPETRFASWPAPSTVAPFGAILTLIRRPATSTASPRPKHGTSSGKARTSAK